jgi:hypothetical protein
VPDSALPLQWPAGPGNQPHTPQDRCNAIRTWVAAWNSCHTGDALKSEPLAAPAPGSRLIPSLFYPAADVSVPLWPTNECGLLRCYCAAAALCIRCVVVAARSLSACCLLRRPSMPKAGTCHCLTHCCLAASPAGALALRAAEALMDPGFHVQDAYGLPGSRAAGPTAQGHSGAGWKAMKVGGLGCGGPGCLGPAGKRRL